MRMKENEYMLSRIIRMLGHNISRGHNRGNLQGLNGNSGEKYGSRYGLILLLVGTLWACDTVPTHQEKKLHLDILATHEKFPYPAVDVALGENFQDQEQRLAYEIAHEIMNTVDRYDKKYHMAFRDAHPKAHGCVRAEFHTYDLTKDKSYSDYVKGIFAEAQSYEAIIRFSNSSENPKGNDHDRDARGMAIKLVKRVNLEGSAEISAKRTMNQDFIMINHPVFILDDAKDYLTLVQAQNSESTIDKFLRILWALGLRGLYNAYNTIFQDPITNPLETQYYSMVPYRLGHEHDSDRIAVKYSARPFSTDHENPSYKKSDYFRSCLPFPEKSPINEKDENFLRTALKTTLGNGDACMEFMVQKRPSGGNVENSQLAWEDKGGSQFVPVALIKILKQDFDTPKQNTQCENESFNPWHALEEHKPLGAVNRLRKVIYPIISEYRHKLNQNQSQENTVRPNF